MCLVICSSEHAARTVFVEIVVRWVQDESPHPWTQWGGQVLEMANDDIPVMFSEAPGDAP